MNQSLSKFETVMANPNRHRRLMFERLFAVTSGLDAPTVLELGTNRGNTAAVFAEACSRNSGHLISVDINDCSRACHADCFQFIQSDSKDTAYILSKAPELKNGIDVLLIDSLHEAAHVEAEILRWWPYVKRGGHIFLDDVDSHIYRPGQRKDTTSSELRNEEIRSVVERTFYSNPDALDLCIHYGSTGMAEMVKLSDMGHPLSPPQSFRRRDPAKRALFQIKRLLRQVSKR